MLRFFAWLFGTLFLLLVLVVGGIYVAYQHFLGPGPSRASITVVVPRGSHLGSIGERLERAGVIDNGQIFAIGARLLGNGRPLLAGEYEFPAGVSQRDVMQQMIDGRTVKRRLTVPEGLTAAEIVELVRGADGLDGAVADSRKPSEGSLLPETYFYSWGDTRAGMIERMQAAMDKTLAELWANRAANLPLDNPLDAVTLASIVEKETAVPEERPRVAAVFYNRLARGMKLQSDPTVIYALTDGKAPLGRPLAHADLEAASPYNTYVAAGLPPGPIANPGRASLLAVLHPMATQELYFVADGNGGHVFATTLDEHNRNVAKWRKLNQP
jgi:peptidoglycan lytic transglycosylase G